MMPRAALLLLLLLLCAPVAAAKANIFMLLTDDQDVTLGGLDGHAHDMPFVPGPNPMPKLQKLLTEKGTTFSNAFVHTPICCPSRSSYMTGKYLHNSGTFENDISHGCSNQTWADGPEQRAFAAHAKQAGYHTSCAYQHEPHCVQHPPRGAGALTDCLCFQTPAST